jgi:hypothetical protein
MQNTDIWDWQLDKLDLDKVLDQLLILALHLAA